MSDNKQLNQFYHLYALAQERSGTTMDDHRREDLNRALKEILASGEVGGVQELFDLLTVQPVSHPLWQKIIRAITIGETYFFRNQAHFQALQQHLLPDMIRERQKSGQRQIRIWSAGCATGEEPYSLAILLRELIPDLSQWSIMILATDINQNFLEMARQGLYSERAFRAETPEWVKTRWFKHEEGKYRIDRAVRDMVYFRQLNLISDDYPSYDNSTMHMDILICRNVTIYFDISTTRKIVDRFYRAINIGGWLIVGHSEPQIEVYQQFTTRNFDKTVFYQKVPVPLSAPPPKVTLPELPVIPPRPAKLVAAKPLATKLPVQAKPKSAAAPKPAPPSAPLSAPLSAQKPTPKPEKPQPDAEDTPESLWERAKQAADDENWDTTMELLNKAEQFDNLQAQVHYLRGLVYLHTGQLDTALVALRQAVYCDSGLALAHYALGDLYTRWGKQKDAEKHWNRAKTALAGLQPDAHVPFGDEELTVEMLLGLLDYRLGQP